MVPIGSAMVIAHACLVLFAPLTHQRRRSRKNTLFCGHFGASIARRSKSSSRSAATSTAFLADNKFAMSLKRPHGQAAGGQQVEASRYRRGTSRVYCNFCGGSLLAWRCSVVARRRGREVVASGTGIEPAAALLRKGVTAAHQHPAKTLRRPDLSAAPF